MRRGSHAFLCVVVDGVLEALRGGGGRGGRRGGRAGRGEQRVEGGSLVARRGKIA